MNLFRKVKPVEVVIREKCPCGAEIEFIGPIDWAMEQHQNWINRHTKVENHAT